LYFPVPDTFSTLTLTFWPVGTVPAFVQTLFPGWSTEYLPGPQSLRVELGHVAGSSVYTQFQIT
jgi:hypothetical protein